MDSPIQPTADPALNQAYLDLRREARANGLHGRTRTIYAVYGLFLAAGIAISVALLAITANPLVQAVNAVFLAFVLVQGGMLAHDLTHGQVFASHRANALFGSLTWALLNGISQSRWYAQHNAHHVHVNQDGHDPDLGIPFRFSPEQTNDGALVRFFRPYQHMWFFAALPLVYPGMVLGSVAHNLRNMTPAAAAELVLIAVHFAGFFAITFFFLPIPTALLFFALHFVVGGLYMGVVFAPNHKGEEVLKASQAVTWLHQITSTRNIFASRWAFVVFGGLNFQIEHHLFPSMSRFKAWDAQKLVR